MDPITTISAPKLADTDPIPEVSNIFFSAVSNLQNYVGQGFDTTFDVAENPVSQGAAGSVLPFQATQSATDKITVSDGTIDGVASSFSETTIVGDRSVYLDVTVNASGFVTAIGLQLTTSAPTDTATNAHILLADVTFSGGAITGITNYRSGSLGHAYGGGTEHIFWRV